MHRKLSEQQVQLHCLSRECFQQLLIKVIIYYSLCLGCRLFLLTYFKPQFSSVDTKADMILVALSLAMGAAGIGLSLRSMPKHWYLEKTLTPLGERFVKSLVDNQFTQDDWHREFRELEKIEMTSGTSMTQEKHSVLEKWSEIYYLENKNQLQNYRLKSSFHEFMFAAVSSLFIPAIPAIIILLQNRIN